MKNWVAGLASAAGALAAFPLAAGAEVQSTPPKACEHGQFTAAEGASNRDNLLQFIIHDNKAVQCMFDVPPDFHLPH